MLPKTLLAFTSALLLGGAAVVVWMAAGDGAPPARAAANETSTRAAAAAVGSGVAPRDEHAPALASLAERTTAGGQQPVSARPIPDDAEWITVTVVDKETKAPVAGALVRWFDDSAWSFLHEQQPLLQDERAWLAYDGERLADSAGWCTTADAGGKARVAVTQDTSVLAESDDRFGMLYLRPNTLEPAGGHLVELGPDRRVQVQVVDDGGTPCTDVLVALDTLVNGEDLGWSALARTQAPDGVATLRRLQPFVDVDWIARAGNVVLRPRVGLPGHEVYGAAFASHELPEQTIVLRLPPCGSVRVRGEFAGKRLPGFDVVVMQSGDIDWTRCMSSRRVDADGWARYPFVPLGKQFSAWSEAFGGVWAEFAGPVRAGQQVDAVLAPVDGAIVLRGRLLARDRAPVTAHDVTLRAWGPEFDSTVTARTDANGRFEVSLGPVRDDCRVDRIRIDCERKGQPTLRALAAARTLRAGVEDLGDLMPADLPLIAGGQFTSVQPVPFAEVGIWINRFTDGGEWQWVQDTLAHVDVDGTFAVRGDIEPGRYRLVAGARHVLPVVPIEFPLGTRDLVVALDRGCRVAASLLLPAKTPEDTVLAQLVPATPPSDPDALHDRLCASPTQAGKERRDLSWQTVPPGTYTLELSSHAEAPLLRIPDIHVPGDDGGDPRLRDIDLRPLVQLVTLNVHGATGELLEQASGTAILAGTSRATARAHPFWGNGVPLLLPRGPVDLVVCVEGYRPKPCRTNGDRADVRLDPWPTIHVEFENMPPLPQGVVAYASLAALDAPKRAYRTLRGEEDCAQLFGPPECRQEIANGTAELAIGDGEHTLSVHVVAGESGRQENIRVRQPATVLPTSDRVSVRVPAAEWRRAIDAVAEPK